ncbi:MAG TPA: hypothetical protein VI384_05340 [Candidatus Dormibacteraeota bacterium]
MSLRVDIHEAIDDVAADEQAIASRVVAAMTFTPAPVKSAKSTPRRWSSSLRGIGSLAAALLVVALIGAVVVGGRAWRHSTSPETRPQQTLVKQLEARQLNLAVIGAEAPCPVTSHLGSPDVTLAGSAWSDDAGRYWDMAAVTASSGTGPVLIRGVDLRTGNAMFFVGSWAYGPVVGTDVWDGAAVTYHSELLLDPSHPTRESVGQGLSRWTFTAGTSPNGGPTWCFGLQMDGAGFSQTVVLAR